MKQVIVVRKDLKLGLGTLVAQCCDAFLDVSESCRVKKRKLFTAWLNSGAKKVVVKANSLDELLQLKRQADEAGIVNSLVVDMGLTQVEPGTITALAIGPDEDEKIDKITGKLKLL